MYIVHFWFVFEKEQKTKEIESQSQKLCLRYQHVEWQILADCQHLVFAKVLLYLMKLSLIGKPFSLYAARDRVIFFPIQLYSILLSGFKVYFLYLIIRNIDYNVSWFACELFLNRSEGQKYFSESILFTN